MDLREFINEGRQTNGLQSLNEAKGDHAGWIVFYNGKQHEITKDEADSLYGAKKVAIEKLKVPKSKQAGLRVHVAVEEGLDEETREESLTLNEEAYDWLRDNGLNPRKRYSVRSLENAIGRSLSDNEISWLKSEGVLESVNEAKGDTEYFEAIGKIVSQAGSNPKLSKYFKNGNILIGDIKDLGKDKVIKLANSLEDYINE